MTATLCGFDGKLPSRGDFIGRGLPRSFLTPWQAWVDAALSASRTALGEAWLPAWMVAPIWHFALPGGACGPDAVLGLLLPSVDRVGRHYPLTVAAVFAGRGPAPDIVIGRPWLESVETLALAALACDHTPEALMQALAAVPPPDADGPAAASGATAAGGPAAAAVWWTAGSPRVPGARAAMAGLPGPSSFAGMIDAGGA
jgi:type VI secretion system protein ImpM